MTQIGADCLAFRFGPDGKILAIDFKNRLSQDEVIYGFGEKYDRFNHNGSVLTLWGTDDWLGNGVGLANTTYKPLPIFHSSKGYMVFDNSSYRLRADVGRTQPNQYRITQQGPIFDYYFLMGAPEKTLQSYTALTGRVPLPPKWVFEPWMGRGGGAWESVRRTSSRGVGGRKSHPPLRGVGHPSFRDLCRRSFRPFTGTEPFHDSAGIRVLGYFMPADVPLRLQQRLMPELKPDQLPILRFRSGDRPRLRREQLHRFHQPQRAGALPARVKGSLGPWPGRKHGGFWRFDSGRRYVLRRPARRRDAQLLLLRLSTDGQRGIPGETRQRFHLICERSRARHAKMGRPICRRSPG